MHAFTSVDYRWKRILDEFHEREGDDSSDSDDEFAKERARASQFAKERAKAAKFAKQAMKEQVKHLSTSSTPLSV